jgi:tetratricopeptide (TPR) repeat protein
LSRDEWFHNEDWNSKIEAEFSSRLKRARRKSEYLRIQAICLVKKHPRITLALLDQYFDLGDHLFDASALLTQAEAYKALNLIDDALKSVKKALQREKEFPNTKTIAWVEYALLVVFNNQSSLYDNVLRVLADYKQDSTIFPIHGFLWNAIHATIYSEWRKVSMAKEFAQKALNFAELTYSGFYHHPKLGLVDDKYNELKISMKRIIEN